MSVAGLPGGSGGVWGGDPGSTWPSLANRDRAHEHRQVKCCHPCPRMQRIGIHRRSTSKAGPTSCGLTLVASADAYAGASGAALARPDGSWRRARGAASESMHPARSTCLPGGGRSEAARHPVPSSGATTLVPRRLGCSKGQGSPSVHGHSPGRLACPVTHPCNLFLLDLRHKRPVAPGTAPRRERDHAVRGLLGARDCRSDEHWHQLRHRAAAEPGSRWPNAPCPGAGTKTRSAGLAAAFRPGARALPKSPRRP